MDDDELLELIAEVTRADGPSERVIEAARRSRSWADLDAELAALVEDSAESMLATSRSAASRRLVFESSTGVVDVEIEPESNVMTGRVDPAAVIVVESSTGQRVAIASGSPVSEFSHAPTAPGPVRLEMTDQLSTWRTGWFTI